MPKVNQTAVALAAAVQKMDRSTGMAHSFIVHMAKADGTGRQVQKVAVIALGWADAWGLMGDAVVIFMNDPEGRVVETIHRDLPLSR